MRTPHAIAWAALHCCFGCGNWGEGHPQTDPAQPMPGAQGEKDETSPRLRGDTRPQRIEIATIGEFETRWLVVEQIQEGAAGAWARGTFDQSRNALVIKTRDVRQFAIDTAEAGVTWQKPVVLSIDGSVSELRRRPHAVIHLRRSPQAEWTVIEP